MKARYLLASDMDGTVIPLDGGTERFAEIERFRGLMERHPDVALAYVTGRHLELGLNGVSRFNLPMPDIFVCDVGTAIYFKKNGRWQKDEGYRQELRRAWRNLSGKDIGALLLGMEELSAQEEEKQQEFKQSYYVSPAVDRKTIVRNIKERLAEKSIDANVIYSVDPEKNVGLIDVLPVIAAKDYALRHLRETLRLEWDNIVYAGDSGNDLLAFTSGFNAIVVHNTGEDVKQEVRRQMTRKRLGKRLFFAAHNYVSGVIEGCFHFNLFRKKP